MNERAANYIKSRRITGGEIILVKQLVKEGRSDIEIDFDLLNYGSDEVSKHLHNRASVEADALEGPADRIEDAVSRGDITRSEAIDAAKRLRKKANFIRLGIKRVFPNL